MPSDGAARRPAATPRRAWVVWAFGAFAYAMAVFHRGSLSVAGLEAQERLGASATALSALGMLQFGLYAAMQVPVGVLLDRFGTRRMVTVGALVMAVSQAVLAVADDVPTAVAARALLGVGDAMTFISVLRLIPAWFAPQRAPVLTQLTGLLGGLGQVAASYPLVALLAGPGWTATFLGAAVLGLVAAVSTVLVVRDTPGREPRVRPPLALGALPAQVRQTWRRPGTKVAFWVHFTTQFSGFTFMTLWGYPYLVEGQGVSPAVAGSLISVLVVVGMGLGPLFGAIAGRWPDHRWHLVLTIVGSTALVWTVVLVWPGRAPLPLLVALAVVLASNGPGSLLAFDFARTSSPPERLGTAIGVTNIGGFTASVLTILVLGVTLDLLAPGGDPGPADYRGAFALQYVGWAVGLLAIARHRRRVGARPGQGRSPAVAGQQER